MIGLLEKMTDFFTARVKGYDEHMLNDVSGCREAYDKMAELLPGTVESLLDLGCGTGLELDEIFRIHPDISVTGIDMTKAMLDALRLKHPDKAMTLINGSYFDIDFGIERFDAIISFQTMHHFTHDRKTKLYSRVYEALKPGGKYIECDYMVIAQKDEDFLFRESERIRREQSLSEDEFYHFDTPCTVDNQLKMLRTAGFNKAKMVWRLENTTIVIAEKAK